jgi:hypothetical protein
MTDMRQALITYGMSKDEVNKLDDEQVKLIFAEENMKAEELDKVDFEEPEIAEEAVDEIDTPQIGDPLWHDYVMSQFLDEECIIIKEKKYPTVDGMRRLVEHLVSSIKALRTTVLQFPDSINEKRSTVKVTLELMNETVFEGAADSFWGNTAQIYNKFPVSIAETRAEGRALKKALRLRKVVSAEEIDGLSEDTEEGITSTQLQFLDVMCSTNRLNINVKKLCTLYELPENPKKLKHIDAIMLNEKLTSYQQDTTIIPEEIKGYEEGWKD